MRRGDVYWADVPPPVGRRPVLVVTRNNAIPVLDGVVVAPITRQARGISSEVPLGAEEGLEEDCVAACDNLATLLKSRLDAQPVGALGPATIFKLDAALRFALEIIY